MGFVGVRAFSPPVVLPIARRAKIIFLPLRGFNLTQQTTMISRTKKDAITKPPGEPIPSGVGIPRSKNPGADATRLVVWSALIFRLRGNNNQCEHTSMSSFQTNQVF